MNKFHNTLLVAIICLMVQGISASQENQVTFPDQATKDRAVAWAVGCGKVCGAIWAGLNMHNIFNVMIHSDQSMIHRKRILMPEEYGKYAPGSSKLGNIFRGNNVITKTVLITALKKMPYSIAGFGLWDAYSRYAS